MISEYFISTYLPFRYLLISLLNSGYPALVGWLRAVNNELVTQHTAINQIRAAVERIEAAVLETPAAAAAAPAKMPEQFPLANRNEFADCDRLSRKLCSVAK